MSLAKQKTFRIGDLAKIALGTDELANERLIVLQSVFLGLLRKLNCHNETVTINGSAAKWLSKLLNERPNSCQYNFQFENIESFQKEYQLLEELEKQKQEIEAKIKRHFQQIRNRKRTTIFAANSWRVYSSPTEDLGAVCLKQNRNYWFLIESSVFNNELRRRIVPPVVDKLKEFEDKIDGMQNQLAEITQMADKTTEKLQNVDFIIKDIEDLRSFVNMREQDFHNVTAEVDEMLNCKLHRVTVPALKKYLEKRFDDANTHLRVLQAKAKKCPPTKPLLIEDKKTCLSCGHLRDFKMLNKFKNLKSVDENIKCSGCNLLKDSSIREKIKRMQYSGPAGSHRPRKSKQTLSLCESDSKRQNILKDASGQPENLNTFMGERESCKGRKVLEYGPLA